MLNQQLIYLVSLVIINFLIINCIVTCLQFHSICICVISFLISWFISNEIIYKFMNSLISISPKNYALLITGCDTGFGHQLTIESDKLGFHVFAGVLFPDGIGAKNLQSVCSERLKVIKMDVTKFDEVLNVINQIELSGLPLWAVVNNAGIIFNSPIEWGSDVNQLSKTFDVNVLGTVRVTKLSIPLLKKSNGRIINVCSIAGRFTFPGITSYCMSKHAVRSFSDGLRRELNNIKVITIEPTIYKTPIADWNIIKNNVDQVWNETPKQVQNSFDEKWRKNYYQMTEMVLQFSRKQTKEVVNVMISAIIQKEPQIYYKCGGSLDHILLFPFTYLPELIQDFVLFVLFSKNQLMDGLYRILLSNTRSN